MAQVGSVSLGRVQPRTGGLLPPKVVDLLKGETHAAVKLRAGQDLVVNLPSHPITGFDWEVLGTSALGKPAKREFIPTSVGIGPSGITRLTWHTGVDHRGDHQVQLGYYNPSQGFTARRCDLSLSVV